MVDLGGVTETANSNDENDIDEETMYVIPIEEIIFVRKRGQSTRGVAGVVEWSF